TPYLHSFPTRRSSDLFTFSNREAAESCQPVHARHGRVVQTDDHRPRTGLSSDQQKNRSHRPESFRRGIHPGAESVGAKTGDPARSEEHTSELQSRVDL